MKKIFEWIGIVALCMVIGFVVSQIYVAFDSRQSVPVDQIVDGYISEIEEFRQLARDAEAAAEESDKKAEAAEIAQRQAEAAAAGKDAAMIEKDREISALYSEIEILTKDNPCETPVIDELNFEEAARLIKDLCSIGRKQKQALFAWEEKDKLSTGKIDNLKAALTACNTKADSYKKSRDSLRVSVAAQNEALDKYEFEVVPALEKELKKKKRRSFWEKMKYYLVGAAFGAAGYAVFKKK